ncbi:MAG: adenylate/guanylate cyclase domain-containing protein [Candidatus Sericytochromatia bacterium]|nr:adenylate/guanylate cyclase domain-containing protein [Candidatus Sericytochromatia bacterium]
MIRLFRGYTGLLRPRTSVAPGIADHAEKRLPLAGRMISGLLPSCLLFGYMAVTGGFDSASFARALGAFVLTFAVMSFIIVRGVMFWSAPMRRVLRELELGSEISPPDLQNARRIAISIPYRSAMGSVLTWGFVYPRVISWAIEAFGGPPSGDLAYGGWLVGPLTGVVALLSYDILMRPVFAALFEGADPMEHRSGWMLSVRGRVMVSVIFVGPYWFAMAMLLLAHELERGLAPGDTLPLLSYLLAVSVLLCVVFAMLIRHNLTRPIERISKGLEHVEEGRLDVRLPIESNDRLGQLAFRYNHMAEGLDERRRLEDAMARYTSPEIAQSAKRGTASLGVRREHLVVLFSDVRSFTAMSERLSPEELVDSLNRYFPFMVDAVRGEGGSVNKFIGDGMMALFGAPSKLADPELAAIRAAQQMQRALVLFNGDQRLRGLPQFAIGIGITSGMGVVGNIGSEDRLEYTAIGDVVNTAARIEGLTKEVGVGILIDDATARAVEGRVELRPCGALAVKGKEAVVRVHEPLEILMPKG